MKEFDEDSLAPCNGKDGQPVYVAFKGRVIDVSGSRLWKTGLHMKRHPAGRDLTTDIQAAPHGPEVLDKFPQVGTIKEKNGEEGSIPEPLEKLLKLIPFLRRHPHPMLVHFPIAFSISPALFIILYLVTGDGSFETTALNCLGAGILFSIPAILTGFFTWWINYRARPMKNVRIKIYCSLLLVAFALGTFVWRVVHPDVLLSMSGRGILYVLLVFSLIPIVSVIGWYGATLTFPLERE